MKGLNYKLILIIIYLACSARTCTEDEESNARKEENYISNLKNDLKEVFTSDSLSEQFLRAYEITASDMLNDFADYLKIISDTNLDPEFRQHSAVMVRNLFISDKIKLSGLSNNYPESALYTLDRLLDHILSEGMPVWFKPVQIIVTAPFAAENDSTFIGNLSCKLECQALSSKGTSEILPDIITVDIYLVKRYQYFGDNHIKIWEAYLGDIN
ncbi:MAG: hypothetical protein A2X05_03635 [Bacteroidetes bacterium GWE2_41_25]|nr:MAG: hypothetical protein A2X03_06395 [Bacteroidetes bacterium GWA2_40_15]OFX91938.1 MAG: hypothetical protein A2X05_03635 [Bacteroidetes bacterium GWE2_41_25]OFX95661.1 MAG: hypothetical protein A2X06_02790 [Bacteroidetes bacterium GWC2_40_22]OFY58093.1 MAG: hypothetical protein A2X04_07520 [Bacteroidetes bacterium GWF2_41_9]HAM08940.1 hypothetical protein [Bacteroidales bacterium]